MAQQVLMPRLSSDMTQGRIVEWVRQVGDAVKEGDPLLLIESDKAEVEVPAPGSGTLRSILIPVGEEVDVGAVLAILATPDELLEERPRVAAAQPAVRAEVEPAAVLPAAVSATGVPPQLAVAAGAAPRDSTPDGTSGATARHPASPAARRAARELGVELNSVPGTGPDGMITDADVRAFAAGRATTASGSPSAPGAAATVEVSATDEIIPLTARRRRMAERLQTSRQTAADVTTIVDVDMSAVAGLRRGLGISYTAYVAWAACQSLREFPILNASLVSDEVRVHKEIHLGVAVAADEGLVVVVVRSADRKGVAEISRDVDDLAEKVRSGRAGPEVMTGSTFTVTNSGAFGSLMFTPIINLPEVAILGMGKVADTPVVRDGAVVVRKVMYLCLTYDHRVIDGAPAVKFLQAVKRRLEELTANPPAVQ
jgi:pyruvate/2-oxoglutarate dehydrogenase complex dihydrolipoamide acyltransferase (E2) component